MATYTEHYDLIKPDETDIYNVEDFNENMDTIDSVMAVAEQGMENISEKIGTSAEGNTLFSLLESGAKNGFTAIKSIQHIVKTLDKQISESVFPLEKTVIPENCLVISERIFSNTGHANFKIQHTLNADTIYLSHVYTSTDTYTVGFWVIEFM